MREEKFTEREREIYEFVISEYLKYGSVDKVFRKNHYDIPISFMGVHRLLDKWGIVKAAGPNSRLSEALTFLVLLSDERIPLERLYRSLPPSFKTSMATMHRILQNVKEEIIRRSGTALVITLGGKKDQILVGEDVSTPRVEVGKPFGSISLPMTYSKFSEAGETSILRVLQQEVFTLQSIKRNFPLGVIPQNPKPFMYLDIADVRVEVYHIELSKDFAVPFSSFKIRNHRFQEAYEILEERGNFRTGVREIVAGYLRRDRKEPILAKSLLNLAISKLAEAAA